MPLGFGLRFGRLLTGRRSNPVLYTSPGYQPSKTGRWHIVERRNGTVFAEWIDGGAPTQWATWLTDHTGTREAMRVFGAHSSAKADYETRSGERAAPIDPYRAGNDDDWVPPPGGIGAATAPPPLIEDPAPPITPPKWKNVESH